MKQMINELLTDCSDKDFFCFSLTCPECNKVWKSTPIRFSKAGKQPDTESKQIIYKTLYQREKEQARKRALEEAAFQFNLCPFCEQIVCNDCFLLCDDLDMCRSCAVRLHESGEQASFIGWMTG
ncbi:MAG: hypothetical protein J5968_04010 [Oscillospiraceae bacterium]|nr:hypothetical protein [Oscillospiraceae bacterium]MBP1557626.1 hypothetical protein [Oscillospiraceae bacterium]MBP1578343.1 hypothetical protein [Oscillospiraceae bacterium]